MMVSEPILFMFSLIDTAAILFLLVYYVITLSDLECDYLNAQECCDKLNIWIAPKYIAHGFLSFLFLINGQWLLMLGNLPMTFYLTYQILLKPSGNIGVYDPTEIHNRGMLSKHMQTCVIHLGYYLFFFFVYLYCMINSMLKGNPIKSSDPYELADF